MALKAEDLKVESFTTTPIGDKTTLPTIIVNPNEPTPATHCYWCPPGTLDCL